MKKRCKKYVPEGGRSARLRQCARYAKRDGYCHQHHPDAVAERLRKAEERYEAKLKSSTAYRLGEARDRIAELEAGIREYLSVFTADEWTTEDQMLAELIGMEPSTDTGDT